LLLLDLWTPQPLRLPTLLTLMTTTMAVVPLLPLRLLLLLQLLPEEGEELLPLVHASCLCVVVSLTLRGVASKVEKGEGVLVLDVWV